MIKNANVMIVMSMVLATCVAAATSEETQANTFCEKFPTLHMCRLRDELTGSLVELQFLLHDGAEAAASSGLQALPAQEIQKRKSAFVRFGKRSSDDAASEMDDSMEMEKRKSAFVRFGRAAGAEKRKSQYIRFGK